MRKICIFCCSKITHKLGCSSAQCLYDLKNKIGSFEKYANVEDIELVGLASCPGCPSEIAPERIINQIENLIEFKMDAIHFTNCINTFCSSRFAYQSLIQHNYPEVDVIFGTGNLHITKVQQEIVGKITVQAKKAGNESKEMGFNQMNMLLN